MKQILFVSGSELSAQLKLSLSELSNRGFRFMTVAEFSKVIISLKNSCIDTVVINSESRKLEAYELAKDIKDHFKSSIKVFVYLPESSANEGSKFGLVNAEVEDDKSIASLVNKISPEGSQGYVIDENITAIYSLHGGVGASTISLALAEYFYQGKEKTLLAETTNNFGLKRLLNLEDGHAILSRDYSRDFNQGKDLDWFKAFLQESLLVPGSFYLNLFNNISERHGFNASFAAKVEELSVNLDEQISNFENSNEVLFTKQEFVSNLLGISNSMKLSAKELSGDSLTLFFEILQLGSQLVDIFIFDIGSDCFSNLNQQILKTAKNLVIVFRDNIDLKEEYLAQKEFLERAYRLKITPVLVPDIYQQNSYKKFSSQDWQELIGDIPVVYPYAPESMASFVFDHEPLIRNKKINQFAKALSERVNPKLGFEKQGSGVLKLIEKKSLINWG